MNERELDLGDLGNVVEAMRLLCILRSSSISFTNVHAPSLRETARDRRRAELVAHSLWKRRVSTQAYGHNTNVSLGSFQRSRSETRRVPSEHQGSHLQLMYFLPHRRRLFLELTSNPQT